MSIMILSAAAALLVGWIGGLYLVWELHFTPQMAASYVLAAVWDIALLAGVLVCAWQLTKSCALLEQLVRRPSPPPAKTLGVEETLQSTKGADALRDKWSGIRRERWSDDR